MTSRAFTLIELVMVIAIVIAIAAMILGATGMIRRQVKVQRTQTIISAIAQALEVVRSSQGGLVSPAEHPLAGSAAGTGQRPRFVRADGTPVSIPGGSIPVVGLTSLTQADAALRPLLLLPDDRFAESGVPLLYGLRRSDLGVLGPARQGISEYRRVAAPRAGSAYSASQVAGLGAISPPDRADGAVPRGATPDEVGEVVDAQIGGAVLKELSAMQALGTSGPAAVPVWNGRAMAEPGPVDDAKGSWLWDPADGARKPYRLPGKAAYDAWGRELLFSVQPGGTVVITSAGADGFFRWSPGADHVFQTQPADAGPSGDDTDASRDNITSAAGAR